MPIFVVGVLLTALLVVSWVGVGTSLWILAGTIVLVGFIAALSGRVW